MKQSLDTRTKLLTKNPISLMIELSIPAVLGMVVVPMVGGMGIRGVWLAIALTDAILVVITVLMMLSEFRKMPGTNGIKQ